jgi:hypothetical protein
LPELTTALLAAGFGQDDVRKLLGGHYARVIAASVARSARMARGDAAFVQALLDGRWPRSASSSLAQANDGLDRRSDPPLFGFDNASSRKTSGREPIHECGVSSRS